MNMASFEIDDSKRVLRNEGINTTFEETNSYSNTN